MRDLKNLNISESIKAKKLIFKEGWLDKWDRFTIYLLFSWGSILPFLIFFDPHRDISKTGFGYYVLFLFSIFCLYVIYRKAMEKNLTKIESNFNMERNKEIVIEHFEKENLEKYRNAKNLVIYNGDNFFSINARYKTSRIVIFEDNNVYFTIIKDNFRLNIPVLTSQISLRNDLFRLLKNKIGSCQQGLQSNAGF